ncbi:hypothetical protein DIQ79_22805 [Mycolicibacterium smegmatis]|uniref:Uncharacterized protein n=1 Tax=Mycolicibacterium smegmatis (strain ATCC 700084 / mc(2)155) TaxID=246196 RepID=A0QVF0_MYCS2|nr:hypothetical protein MSMEG_2551 [Mycolicibacterium smegmatis MC2 155]TBM44245.1 hypothetical protein DIQ86_17125 [Mycolicibacterium smegmatis]TBH32159.1 hypothetical protein EYS45_24555 [Mycolicibacterium smegmatis MC2 155]TBM48871.1 hypothetical protein DIQ85_23100 [Mycolicibacterium smegmatis]TBM57719.1 hypothetical protein DIQ83_24865 [Mycolicibacterium smegmatis]
MSIDFGLSELRHLADQLEISALLTRHRGPASNVGLCACSRR